MSQKCDFCEKDAVLGVMVGRSMVCTCAEHSGIPGMKELDEQDEQAVGGVLSESEV